MQRIINADNNYSELDEYLKDLGVKKLFLVCGNSIKLMSLNEYFNVIKERLGIEIIRFIRFQPNPQYSSVVDGLKEFHLHNCDMIAAVGGGSAMDVAKCIKFFSNMNDDADHLAQRIEPNDMPFLAVPTTAGTGSEATQFAVIYNEEKKLSIAHESGIPNAVMFDVGAVKTLPERHRKASMLDALCHGLESLWSVNSTEESRRYSVEAIRFVLKYKDSYLSNSDDGIKNMLIAANTAGKAINITQTTAGHAMCYKLTGLYGIPHGHSAALCNKVLIPFMIRNADKCIDKRGSGYLLSIFDDAASVMGCKSKEELPSKFANLVDELGLKAPKNASEEDISILCDSVNEERLKNNPVKLTYEDIKKMYREILNIEEIKNES